jgi:hypothetical protein
MLKMPRFMLTPADLNRTTRHYPLIGSDDML